MTQVLVGLSIPTKGWLDLRAIGDLVRSWHDLIDYRGIHWRGDFGRYQPTSEKSLKDSGAMSQNDARLQPERATEAK